MSEHNRSRHLLLRLKVAVAPNHSQTRRLPWQPMVGCCRPAPHQPLRRRDSYRGSQGFIWEREYSYERGILAYQGRNDTEGLNPTCSGKFEHGRYPWQLECLGKFKVTQRRRKHHLSGGEGLMDRRSCPMSIVFGIVKTVTAPSGLEDFAICECRTYPRRTLTRAQLRSE